MILQTLALTTPSPVERVWLLYLGSTEECKWANYSYNIILAVIGSTHEYFMCNCIFQSSHTVQKMCWLSLDI